MSQIAKQNKKAIRQLIKRNKDRLGIKPSKETRQRMSQAQKGRHPTEKTRRKLIAWQLGRKRPNQQGAKHHNAKRVLADGVEYGSIADAAKALGLKHDTLKIRFLRWKKSGKFPNGFAYLD